MKRWYNAVILAILTGILVLAAVNIEWGDVSGTASRAELWLVVLAVVVTIFRFVVWAFKWHLLISSIKVRVAFSRLLVILLGGLFISTATPGANVGGEPIRAYYLAREGGIKKSAALATVTADKSGNYIAFLTYSLFGMLMLMSYFQLERLLLLLILSLLLGILVYLYYRKKAFPYSRGLKLIYKPFSWLLDRRFGDFESFEDYVLSTIAVFKQTTRLLARQRLNLVAILLLSFVMWLTSFVKTYLVFIALGINIDFLLVMAVKAVSVLLGMLSFIPGGLGVTEGAMLAIFASYGIEAKAALAGVLLSRAIYYAFALGIGYLCAVWLRVAYRD